MRRLESCPALPSPAAARTHAPQLDLRLALQTITPIIGGGVDKHEPDRLDGVRVPGLRGQLRGWLRLLLPQATSAKERFQREARLFGRPGGDEGAAAVKPGQAREKPGGDEELLGKSPVSLWIEGPREARVGKIEPAGYHEFDGSRGQFRILPQWTLDKRLAYGLFPLQRDSRALASIAGGGARAQNTPTHPVKTRCTFTLRLRLASPEPRTKEEVELLLLCLWAFLTFGGLGGRTTRGFGALRIESCQASGSAWPQDPFWTALFQEPKDLNDARARLGQVWRALRERDAALAHAAVLLGPSAASAANAHAELLDGLRHFRQGEGQGRRPKNPLTNRPGLSFWPEPMGLRLIHNVRGKHSPPPGLRRDKLSFPRAAFGLPIIAKFKDRDEERANSELVPEGGGRWPSPVRLHPLPCAGQKALPMLLVLPPSQRPIRIKVNKDGLDTFPVKYLGQGASEPNNPLGRHLQVGGDGVDAYVDWLTQSKGYQPLGGGR